MIKNGNLTNDGTRSYTYDCENRLIRIGLRFYKYDYRGRLVKGRYTTTFEFTYDGDQVIAEYDENGELLRKYVYGPGIDEPICMIDATGQSEVMYYYHFDGLGSVVALSDSTGSLIEKYEYDVFGEPTIRDTQDAVLGTSAYGNSYLFTGRRYDVESAKSK